MTFPLSLILSKKKEAILANFLLLKKIDLSCLLLLFEPSNGTQRMMEHDSSARRSGCKLSAGKSVQWPRAPKDAKPQQQRQPGATQQRASRTSMVVRHQRQGSGRHTRGRRRHISEPPRLCRKPASKHCLCQRKTRLHNARVSWNGPGRGR